MRHGLPLALALIPIIASCGVSERGQASKGGDLQTIASIRALCRARIFFGHQSVGENILGGLAALSKESGAPELDMLEGRSAGSLEEPRILHAKIGANGDPFGKIKDFVSIVEGGVGAKADIALMKFCYVDVNEETDVNALFAEYRQALARLRSEYPGLALPMVTLPLTTEQRGPKAWVKRLLGRPVAGEADNAARERFNELVRSEEPGAPLFDLARAEVGPEGDATPFGASGTRTPALRDDYSSDGGHLNAAGSRRVATALVAALAALLR